MSSRVPRARFGLASVGINILIEAEGKKVGLWAPKKGCEAVLCGEPFCKGRPGGRSLKLRG